MEAQVKLSWDVRSPTVRVKAISALPVSAVLSPLGHTHTQVTWREVLRRESYKGQLHVEEVRDELLTNFLNENCMSSDI